MTGLIVETTPIPQGPRVCLQGEAGMGELDLLDRELMRAAAATPAVVVIDLSQLRFISSAGIVAFMKMRNHLTKRNGIVRISGASPEITEAFRRAHLDKLFEFIDEG